MSKHRVVWRNVTPGDNYDGEPFDGTATVSVEVGEHESSVDKASAAIHGLYGFIPYPDEVEKID